MKIKNKKNKKTTGAEAAIKQRASQFIPSFAATAHHETISPIYSQFVV